MSRKEEIMGIAREVVEENQLKQDQCTIEFINDECIRIVTNKMLTEEKRKQIICQIEDRADLANVFVV